MLPFLSLSSFFLATKRPTISSKQWKKRSPHCSRFYFECAFMEVLRASSLRRLVSRLEPFFLRLGKLIFLARPCLRLSRFSSYSAEVSLIFETFLTSPISSGLSQQPTYFISVSCFPSSGFLVLNSPICSSAKDFIPLFFTVLQIYSAYITSLSNYETTAFLSSYSQESDHSESQPRYAHLPIQNSVNPAQAIFFRNISASLKFLRQTSRKPSLFLRVQQSLRGSIAAINSNAAQEKGCCACLYPIQTTWYSQIQKLSGKASPWSMGTRVLVLAVPFAPDITFFITRMFASFLSQLSVRRSKMPTLCTSAVQNWWEPKLPTTSLYQTNCCSDPCLVLALLSLASFSLTIGPSQSSLKLKPGWQNQAYVVAGTPWNPWSSRQAATSLVAHSPESTPLRIPGEPSSALYPLGLLGAQGYSSQGLQTATTFLWLFSRKQVPEVPSAASRGFLAALSPDCTLSMRSVMGCGTCQNMRQGLMTPFSVLRQLQFLTMTMVLPCSILYWSKGFLFYRASSMFLQKSRMSCSASCLCLSLYFYLSSCFFSSFVRIHGKNFSRNLRPKQIMSSKFSSIFQTTLLESVFSSPNYELIILLFTYCPRLRYLALGTFSPYQLQGCDAQMMLGWI